MATLAVQTSTPAAGIAPTYVAATAGGDDFLPGPYTFLHVKNAGGGSITLTADTPGAVSGLAIGNANVAVAAGQERMYGPFPASLFASTTDGLVKVTYTGVTSVTIGVFSLDVPA